MFIEVLLVKTIVERCIFAMKYVKYDLRNWIGKKNLSDSGIC